MKKSIWLLLLICLAYPVLAQVTAHKTATLQVDADGNGKVTPGDTLRYTIVITNTSSTNLLNVQFADTGFSNQTLVAGSIKSTPVARPDGYPNVIGNTLFNVPAAGGVLANDSDPDGDAVTVVGFSALSAHGGTVTVTNNGGFAFLPPAGYQGSDTFTYSISDSNGGTNSTTVTLLISNLVWYVNNAGANGDGRQNSPFNTLTGAATVSGTNDYIYTFQGSGNYTAGIALKNGQNLVGSGDALIVGGTTILNAGSRPTLLVGSGTGVSLASNNIVHGINIGSSSGRAISGGSVLNLVISNVIATATGGASVVLTNGTVNVTLDSATSTSAGGADNGIALNAINGSLVINGGSLGTSAGTDFVVAGGNGTITYAGTINNAAGRAVDISGLTGGSVTLSGNITDTATGISVSGCSGGTVTFSGATKTFNTGANTAISLTSNTGAAINFSNGGLAITTTSGNGFSATGGGTVTVTTGASANTLSSTTGTALNVVNTTIGASGLTFQSINSTTASANSAIVLNNTGSSGGLSVTGTGSTAGSGGTLSNKTVDDISLTSTANVSLNNFIMTIGNNTHSGILGTGVNGFSLTGSTVTGNGVASGGNSGSCIMLTDTTGAVTLNTNTVTAASNQGVWLENSPSSTAVITTLTVIGGSYSHSAQGDGFLSELHGTSAVNTALFSGVTFWTNASYGLNLVQNDNGSYGNGVGAPATGTATITGCVITNSAGLGASFAGGGGSGTGSSYFRFVNNTIIGSHSHAVNFVSGATATGGTYKALVANNIIGNAGVADSGSKLGEGIVVTIQAQGGVVTITNNTIRGLANAPGEFGNRGIDFEDLGPTGSSKGQAAVDLKITGNDINAQDTGGFPLYAIYVSADGQGTGTSGSSVHAEIHGNTVPSSPHGCDTQCNADTAMIDFETVSGATGTMFGTLYTFGSGATVSAQIANNNTGTSGKTCSYLNGGSLTLTGTAPSTVQ